MPRPVHLEFDMGHTKPVDKTPTQPDTEEKRSKLQELIEGQLRQATEELGRSVPRKDEL